MDLLDMLGKAGGGNSIGQLASAAGLDSKDTSKLIAALAPALMRGLKQKTSSDEGLAGLRRALETGGHEKYIDKPELLSSNDTRTDGNKILGHIFGSKDVSRNVAAHAAESTGLSASLIKKALPLLASLAMGAMSKSTSAGKDLGKTLSGGGLGPLASMFDKDGDGGVLDDVLGMVKKFF